MDGLVFSVVFFLLCGFSQSQRQFIPEASLEVLSPSGLRISLPDENPAWRQVAFHINVNEKFRGVDHGHYAEDVYDKSGGRWTLEIPQLKVNQGDVVYYWINVIENNNQGYNALNREYRVGGTSSPSAPPTEPDEHNPEDDVEVVPNGLRRKTKG